MECQYQKCQDHLGDVEQERGNEVFLPAHRMVGVHTSYSEDPVFDWIQNLVEAGWSTSEDSGYVRSEKPRYDYCDTENENNAQDLNGIDQLLQNLFRLWLAPSTKYFSQVLPTGACGRGILCVS